MGVTGPFPVFAEYIYDLCVHSFNVPFLPFMAWSLIHAGCMNCLLALINSHDWTMRYATTFSMETFSLLNSIIYLHKAFQKLQCAHNTLSFAALLYAVIGATGTMLVATFLLHQKIENHFSIATFRIGLKEYAAAISTVLFICLPHIGELSRLDRSTLPVSASLRPTDPTRIRIFVDF